MRKLLDKVLGVLDADKEPRLVDHAPVPVELREDKPSDWRERKLKDARQRHGRAFKCAAPDQDREVIIVPGDVRIIGAHRYPRRAMAASPFPLMRAAGGRS